MENKKKIYIGLGILAVAGFAYWMWNKNKDEEASEKTGGEKKPEEAKASVNGRRGLGNIAVTPRINPQGLVDGGGGWGTSASNWGSNVKKKIIK